MAAFTASSSSSSSSLSLSLVPKSAAFLEPRNHQKKERMLLDKRTMKAVQLSFRLSLSWRRLTSSLASLLVFFLFFLLLHRLSSSSSLVGSGASEKEKSGGSSCVGRSLGVKTSSVVPAASDPMELPAQGGAQTPSFFPAFSYPSLIGVRAEEGSFSGGHDARGTAELRQQRKKPWIGNCPRFGFSFSPLSPPSLLELPSPARSLIDCASRCNDFHYPSSSSSIFSFFTFSSSSAPSSSSLCQGYEYDRRTRLCSLYGALGDSPAVAVPSPYVASGLSPSKTTGSLCVSSCLVSEWSEWTGACPTRSGPAAASSEGESIASVWYQRRMRSIRRLPLWGEEPCPALQELRPCFASWTSLEEGERTRERAEQESALPFRETVSNPPLHHPSAFVSSYFPPPPPPPRYQASSATVGDAQGDWRQEGTSHLNQRRNPRAGYGDGELGEAENRRRLRGQCAMEGIAALGWGCSLRASPSAQSGTELRFVSGLEECQQLCLEDFDCLFFSLDRRPRLRALSTSALSSERTDVGFESPSFRRGYSGGPSGSSYYLSSPFELDAERRNEKGFPSILASQHRGLDVGNRETDMPHPEKEVFGMACYLIHGSEPGCMFESRHFLSGQSPRLGGRVVQCPFDCVPGEWSDWSPCTRPCSPDEAQHRTRSVKIRERHGGRPCQLIETRSCLGSPMYSKANCASAAECTYTPWGPWSPCSSVCEGGVQERTRSFVPSLSPSSSAFSPSVMTVGNIFSNLSQEGSVGSCTALRMIRACNEGISCMSRGECNAGPFSPWSACSAPCGGGHRERRREVFPFLPGTSTTGGSDSRGGVAGVGDSRANQCPGLSSLQVETCNEDVPCGPAACEFSPWEEWSACHPPPSPRLDSPSVGGAASSSSFLSSLHPRSAGEFARVGQRERYRGILRQPRDPLTGRSMPCDLLRQPLLQIEECVLSPADYFAPNLLASPSSAPYISDEECITTPWSDWSSCRVSCGEESGGETEEREGWRTRVRSVLRPRLSLTPPAYGEGRQGLSADSPEGTGGQQGGGGGGEDCGPLVETEICRTRRAKEGEQTDYLDPCSTNANALEANARTHSKGFFRIGGGPNCDMGEWQPWTVCTPDCRRFRVRLPLSPAPKCLSEIEEGACDPSACFPAGNLSASPFAETESPDLFSRGVSSLQQHQNGEGRAHSGGFSSSLGGRVGSGQIEGEERGQSGGASGGMQIGHGRPYPDLRDYPYNAYGGQDSKNFFFSSSNMPPPPSYSSAIFPPSRADVASILCAVCLSVCLTLTIVILFIYFRKKGFRRRFRRRGIVQPLDGGRWEDSTNSSGGSFSEDGEERERFVTSRRAKDSSGEEGLSSSQSAPLYSSLPGDHGSDKQDGGGFVLLPSLTTSKPKEEEEVDEVESDASDKLAKVAVDQDLSFWDEEDEEEDEEAEEKKKVGGEEREHGGGQGETTGKVNSVVGLDGGATREAERDNWAKEGWKD